MSNTTLNQAAIDRTQRQGRRIPANAAPASDYECPVCYTTDPSVGVVSPACGHKICITCYSTVLLQGGRCARCPSCRAEYPRSALEQPAPAVPAVPAPAVPAVPAPAVPAPAVPAPRIERVYFPVHMPAPIFTPPFAHPYIQDPHFQIPYYNSIDDTSSKRLQKARAKGAYEGAMTGLCFIVAGVAATAGALLLR